jgi:uncharacterized protein DUF3224
VSTHSKGRFEVKTWDENPYDETDGGLKLTRASVTKSFRGGIEGEGTLEYLMVYPGGGYAKFVGLERVVGRLGDRWGSFVLEHSGTFEGGVAEASWSVVPGSGTGELRGLRGEGRFASADAQRYPITLDYDLE